MSTPTKYTLADVGCYVDGARGIYAIDAIAKIAESHGATIEDGIGSDNFYDYADQIENEIDDYMNAEFSVEGATWGRSEQGDIGYNRFIGRPSKPHAGPGRDLILKRWQALSAEERAAVVQAARHPLDGSPIDLQSEFGVPVSI